MLKAVVWVVSLLSLMQKLSLKLTLSNVFIVEHIQPHLETPTMTKDEARMRIEEVRQRIAIMNANDIEFSLINEILLNMDKDEMTPDEALEEANKVLNGKQDYH